MDRGARTDLGSKNLGLPASRTALRPYQLVISGEEDGYLQQCVVITFRFPR